MGRIADDARAESSGASSNNSVAIDQEVFAMGCLSKAVIFRIADAEIA